MACENLTQPDQRVSDAVDVRQELDLRIGEGPHGLCWRMQLLGFGYGTEDGVCV